MSADSGGLDSISVAGELLPDLVEVVKRTTADQAEREARVLQAWCSLAGVARWTPDMVRAMNREMAI